MNPNQLRQLQSKIVSIDVVVEDGKSFQVTTFEEKVGQPSEQRILVDKEFYQPRIDKLQEQLNSLIALQDKCAE